MSYKFSGEVQAQFMLGIQCKHCKEFFSDERNIKALAAGEGCRECLEIVVIIKDAKLKPVGF